MRLGAWAVLTAVVLAGCAQAVGTGSDKGSGPPGPAIWQVSATVLEADKGPRLCFQVHSSLPPQCDGFGLVGWSWDMVSDEESAGDTKWTSAHLVGSWDAAAKAFTLTAPPGPPRPLPREPFTLPAGCPRPTGDPSVAPSDDLDVGGWLSEDGVANVPVAPGEGAAMERRLRAQGYKGPLCVIERENTIERLDEVMDEVVNAGDRLGVLVTAGVDVVRGVVDVEVMVAGEAARRYAADRWGDAVVMSQRLRPA